MAASRSGVSIAGALEHSQAGVQANLELIRFRFWMQIMRGCKQGLRLSSSGARLKRGLRKTATCHQIYYTYLYIRINMIHDI